MKTAKVIERVAGIIAGDNNWDVTFEDAAEINEETGWSFDGPEDSNRNWLRYSEVRLSDAQLHEAYDLAQSWLDSPTSAASLRRVEQLNRAWRAEFAIYA